MVNSANWKRTLSAGHRPRILTFVAGLQHPVSPENICLAHHHAAIEIVYHPVGRGETRLNRRALNFGENSVVIYAPAEEHHQIMASEGEDLCVQVAVPKKVAAELRTGLYIARLGATWIIEEMRRLSRAVVPADAAERSVLNLRATAVLLGLLQVSGTRPEGVASAAGWRHVNKAEDFIREHYAGIRSLREVAEHAEISHDHLRHLFKALRGRSLISHLNDVRIARVKLLLTRTLLPLKQIANLCGFRNEYYLSAVFHKLVAMPPGAYRQRFASSN